MHKRARRGRSMNLRNSLIPLITLGLALWAWEHFVQTGNIPPYILPAPSLIAQTLVSDWPSLGPAFAVTLLITLGALALAIFFGVGLALLFASARWIEHAFM